MNITAKAFAATLVFALSVPAPLIGQDRKKLPIEIYTLKQYKTIKVGYPKGWTVTESQYGVAVAEKQGDDSAGLLIFDPVWKGR